MPDSAFESGILFCKHNEYDNHLQTSQKKPLNPQRVSGFFIKCMFLPFQTVKKSD